MSDPDQYVTMSIASLGASTLTQRNNPNFVERKTNDISDIEGTCYASKYEKYSHKQPYQSSDIPGSTPKQLIRTLKNVTDNTLQVDDIPGTRFFIRDKMLATKRSINPLNPQYNLPKFKQIDSLKTHFIRDNIDYTDVEGSTVPIKDYSHKIIRNQLDTNDIEGTKAGYLPNYKIPRKNNPPHNILETKDISERVLLQFEKTTRSSNTLDPKYIINGMIIEDDIKFTKPKTFKKLIIDNSQLKTKDIDGAYAGWIDTSNNKLGRRKDIRNINYINDIEGTQADTIKHSITTQRFINPLNPIYQSLDDGQPLMSVNQPLLPQNITKRPTLGLIDSKPVTSNSITHTNTNTNMNVNSNIQRNAGSFSLNQFNNTTNSGN